MNPTEMAPAPAAAILSRCPNCNTLFRVTPEQLQSAQGKVRCGLCLTIFDAHINHEPGSTHPQATETAAAAAPQSIMTAATSNQKVIAERRRSQTAHQPAPSTIPIPVITTQTERPLLDRRLDGQLQQLRLDPLLSPITRSRRPLLYGILTLLALLLLVAQFAWYRFDQLAANPALRPAFDHLCAFVGCSLPPQRDLQAIAMQQISIASDPQNPEVVVVEIILTNHASFEQSFPDIDLSFVDQQGSILAQRRLQPEHYLTAELSGYKLMPVKTPIHVSLSLIRPEQPAQQIKLRLVLP